MAGETKGGVEQSSGGVFSFLQGLTNLAKPATVEVLIARLGDGNLGPVQSRAAHALAAKAKESPEQLQHIKQAGGVEALESLRGRTNNHNVQIAALEALVALQAKAAVVPLVQIMQESTQDSPTFKDSRLSNWAVDSLHQLLKAQGSFQKAARDAGAVPAIIKMERRPSTKELLHILGPEDSHHIRSSRVSRGTSSTLNIPEAFAESEEAAEAAETEAPAAAHAEAAAKGAGQSVLTS
jgi:hypothetical protein